MFIVSSRRSCDGEGTVSRQTRPAPPSRRSIDHTLSERTRPSRAAKRKASVIQPPFVILQERSVQSPPASLQGKGRDTFAAYRMSFSKARYYRKLRGSRGATPGISPCTHRSDPVHQVSSALPGLPFYVTITQPRSIDPCQLKLHALDLSGDAINSPKIIFSNT